MDEILEIKALKTPRGIAISNGMFKSKINKLAGVNIDLLGSYNFNETKDMTKWISVKDELPKDKQDVIVYDGADMCLTYFEEIIDRRSKKPKGVFVNLNEDFEKVTHWIPVELPPLPKEE